MSVNTSGNTASAAQAAARTATVQQNQGVDLNAKNSAPAAASTDIWDWDTPGLTMPVTLQSTSEALTKLEAALAAIIMPNDPREVRLLAIDNTQETNWRYSVAVIAMRRKTHNWISWMPLLIEATENRPLAGTAVRLGSGDRQVTVQPVPADGLDIAYVQRIEQLLMQTFGQEAVFLHVQGMTVPKDVNFDDIDHLKRIVAEGVRACVTQLAEIDPNFTDLNLSKVQSKNVLVSRLSVTSSGIAGEKRNVVGQPVRQDLEMKLVAIAPVEPNNQGMSQLQSAHSLNGQGTPEELVGVAGAYLDQRILPGQNAYYANQDPKVATRRFVNELVITSVSLPKLATTAALMMMISQLTAVAEQRILHSVLYQHKANSQGDYKGASFDPTDLGVLNYISNVAGAAKPEAWDLKASSFGPTEFLDYVDRVFQPGLAVSIDVPRLAPQAAFMSVLTDCALGKPEALEFLQASLNKLTGNKFNSKFFAATGGSGRLTAEMVFSERNNTLYNGHWNQKVGGQNRNVDIRNVGMTAVLARFGTTDPTMVQKWAQSYLVSNIDPAIRMANKREVLEAYTQDSVVFTGLSDRHTFNTVFLQALVACNVENGFQPVLEFNDPLAGADTGLHAPAFMGAGLMQQTVPGTFAQSAQTANQYGGGGYAHNTASRW